MNYRNLKYIPINLIIRDSWTTNIQIDYRYLGSNMFTTKFWECPTRGPGTWSPGNHIDVWNTITHYLWGWLLFLVIYHIYIYGKMIMAKIYAKLIPPIDGWCNICWLVFYVDTCMNPKNQTAWAMFDPSHHVTPIHWVGRGTIFPRMVFSHRYHALCLRRLLMLEQSILATQNVGGQGCNQMFSICLAIRNQCFILTCTGLW
jgi:hypothetical protein